MKSLAEIEKIDRMLDFYEQALNIATEGYRFFYNEEEDLIEAYSPNYGDFEINCNCSSCAAIMKDINKFLVEHDEL